MAEGGGQPHCPTPRARVECHTYETFDPFEPLMWSTERLYEQSGNLEVGTTSSTNNEVVVGFDSISGDFSATVMSQPDTSGFLPQQDTSLEAYLSRPMMIKSYTWDTNDYLEETFLPWKELLDAYSIGLKTRGYALFRATCKVKITITGSPFFSGRVIASYRPKIAPEDVRRGGIEATEQLMLQSQRMHIFLNPTQSKGGELICPFFWPYDYLTLGTDDDLGEIKMTSFGTLVNYSSGSLTGATIRVYAWFEDVQLRVPTYVQQSGNEGGLLSKPASDVARVAGTLANAPMIGPYAKATELGATALAHLASIFGYSRPRSLADTSKMVPELLGNLANTNVQDQSVVLALDGRQETTIDSRTVGLAGQDDMAFSRIVTIPTYIGSMRWKSTDGADNLLAVFPVQPMYYCCRQLEQENAYTLTACAAVANCFRYWRGSMKFRFVFNTSNFHRGRIAFRYEPLLPKVLANYDMTTGVPSTGGYTMDSSSQIMHIVDIADQNDFTVCVGWANSKSYLYVESDLAYSQLGTLMQWANIADLTGSNANEDTPGWGFNVANGFLLATVMDPLVFPGNTPIDDLYCQVYVSMCDDFDFARARGESIQNLACEPFIQQSGVEGVAEFSTVDEPVQTTEITSMNAPCASSQLSSVYFGESVGSIRTLVKRFGHTFSYPLPNMDADSYYRIRVILWQFVGFFGVTNNGNAGDPLLVDVLGRAGSETIQYDINPTGTTFMHYFMPAFAGWKGSTRMKILPWGGPRTSNIYSAMSIGLTNSAQAASFGYATSPSGSDYSTAIALWRRAQHLNSGNGQATTQKLQKSTVEVEIPWQRNERFLPTGRLWGRNQNLYQRVIISEDNYVDREFDVGGTDIFTAAGEDYTLFWWQGMPTLYRLDDRLESRTWQPWRFLRNDNSLVTS